MQTLSKKGEMTERPTFNEIKLHLVQLLSNFSHHFLLETLKLLITARHSRIEAGFGVCLTAGSRDDILLCRIGETQRPETTTRLWSAYQASERALY